MGHRVSLELKNHEPFHSEVIEYQINIKIIKIRGNVLLAFHESETSAEFKNEFFKVVNQCLFQLRLTIFSITAKSHEFCYCRILDIFH